METSPVSIVHGPTAGPNVPPIELNQQACPVCIEALSSPVELSCGHSLCGGCAGRCGAAGHRHCPVCREPHLLNPDELKARSAEWRSEYRR